MTYGWHTGDDDRGVGTMGELVAIGVSHGRNIRHGRCPTGEIFAIYGVGFAPTMAPTIIMAWANWSPWALSHGRNIRHLWRGFRPYDGIDNTSWHGRIGRHGRCPTGEIFAIYGVGFAPTPVSTIIVAGGVTSPHQPCRQFGLVRFAYRWIDLRAGRMAD